MDCVLVSYKLSVETKTVITDIRHLKLVLQHCCFGCAVMKINYQINQIQLFCIATCL